MFQWWYLFDIFDHLSYKHIPYYSITRVLIFFILCFTIYFQGSFKNIQKDTFETKNYNAPISMILFFSGLLTGVSFNLFLLFIGIFIMIPLLIKLILFIKEHKTIINWSLLWFLCFILSLLINMYFIIEKIR